MMKYKILASAIATLMGVGVANAHVSYNITTSTAGGLGNPADGTAAGPWTGGNGGYSGNLPATWIAFVHNSTMPYSLTASTADALNEGAPSGYVLGMGAKAYKDGSTNWGHTADFGLFKLEHPATVTISVSPDGNSSLRPAFGLWQGWDTSSDASRHQDYLNNGALNSMGSVLGSTLTAYYDSTYCPATGCWAVAPNAGETATLTLPLAAGQYTLILGGYDSAGGPNVKYTATITAVPVPAAAWLLGGALAWLGTWRRRFALGAGSG